MKVKTSLSLSEDLLRTLDRLAGPKRSRSSFVEQILREFVEQREQARRNAADIAAINRHAAELNAVLNDALFFQARADEE